MICLRPKSERSPCQTYVRVATMSSLVRSSNPRDLHVFCTYRRAAWTLPNKHMKMESILKFRGIHGTVSLELPLGTVGQCILAVDQETREPPLLYNRQNMLEHAARNHRRVATSRRRLEVTICCETGSRMYRGIRSDEMLLKKTSTLSYCTPMFFFPIRVR